MKNIIPPRPKTAEFADVNGVKLHYEVYGNGDPLFFLHGYTQSSIAWQDFVNHYSNDFEVYLVDLRGHGKSEPFKEEFSVKESVKDIIALTRHLKIEKIKGVGFSFGGDVLLQIGTLKPELIESMIIIGANADWEATNYPEMLESFKFESIGDFKWIYDFHSGGDEQIRSIIDQLSNYKIKLSDGELKKIKAKTMLVVGDSDESISIESVVKLSKKINNSHLWIVPNTVHYAHDNDNKNEFLRISNKFLKG